MQPDRTNRIHSKDDIDLNKGNKHEFFLTTDQRVYIQHYLPKGYSLISDRERKILKRNFETSKDIEVSIVL